MCVRGICRFRIGLRALPDILSKLPLLVYNWYYCSNKNLVLIDTTASLVGLFNLLILVQKIIYTHGLCWYIYNHIHKQQFQIWSLNIIEFLFLKIALVMYGFINNMCMLHVGMVMFSIKTLLSVRDCCFCTAMVAMHDLPLIKPLFPSITCILGMTHISSMVQISNRNDTFPLHIFFFI